MTTFLSKLKSGDAFRVELGGKYGHIDYRLIHVNVCRAYVEPLKKRKDLDLLEDSPGGRISISPNVECEKIDEELEKLFMAGSTTTNAAAKTTAKAPSTKTKTRISGDRKFDAKKQERPVREGTIRAKLLEAIESGKTDVNKLMKEFGMARSLLVAHVHEMWKCHGYGYTLTDDTVKIIRPVGGVLKTEAKKTTKSAAKPKTKKKPAAADPLDDDPLADEEEDPLA